MRHRVDKYFSSNTFYHNEQKVKPSKMGSTSLIRMYHKNKNHTLDIEDVVT